MLSSREGGEGELLATPLQRSVLEDLASTSSLDLKKKRGKVTNSKFISQIQIVAECVSEKRVLLSLLYLWLVSPDAFYPKSPRPFSYILTVFDSSLLLCFAVLG